MIINNEGIEALKEQFENEFRPQLMKKVYPDDVSGIKYMLTTDEDETYIENKYSEILDEYRPYLIISSASRDIMDEYQRNEWRMEKEWKRHVSIYELEENDEPTDEDARPDFIIARDETNRKLYAALDQLAEVQRKRIEMYFFEDLSLTVIARQEGVAVQVVDKSIKGSIKKLKKIYKMG